MTTFSRAATLFLILGCTIPVVRAAGQGEPPRLLAQPGLSTSQICFAYAGDIWLSPRAGGTAHRLTATPGNESGCRFSPDGKRVAYTAGRDNNTDVYVVDVSGGTPTRITWHPTTDIAVGWTPDGKVLFGSLRDGTSPGGIPFRLYTQDVGGAVATPVELPGTGLDASYSPDGRRLAYLPFLSANAIWKEYRGGRTTPIWIATLADATIEKIPRTNSTDTAPMWVGDTVFFLSDRDGPTTLYAYALRTKQVTRRLTTSGLDIKSAQAGPGAIVYEQFGQVRLYDLTTGTDAAVAIRLEGELTAALPQWVSIGGRLTNPSLSQTGLRAAFEARGEIFTVPAKKGDPRNITNTPGVMERAPAWSPDGQTLAYFTDASGQYELELKPHDGMGAPRRIPLGGGDNFYHGATWSPDGKFIAYGNSRGELWNVEVASGKTTRVAADPFANEIHAIAWSPDSRWISYPRTLANYFSAIFVWDRTTGVAKQATDGMSDAITPAFDANGKYLYFLASTDAGAANDFSMTTFDHPVTRSVYVVVLRKELPSPLAPESDDEKAPADSAAKKPAADSTAKKPSAESKAVTIDFAGISQRIVALPLPPRNYGSLAAGTAGSVIVAELPNLPVVLQSGGGAANMTLSRFDLGERKATTLVEGITDAAISGDGAVLLYKQGDRWAIAPLKAPVKAGEGALSTGNIQVQADPRAEWAQMYREAFRMQRAYFYDPGYHGLDLDATERSYARFLPGLGSRNDLNYLFREAFGNLTVGHLYVGGPGDTPTTAPPAGLLGADYRVRNGRWQFAAVLTGESWNPQLRAPLTQPGVNVQAGEYLLAVNGVPLTASQDVYQALAGTAGKQVVLQVGPSADGVGARTVTVVPTGSETMLRHLAWVDGNRRLVDSLSSGKLAYIYVPNTANEGYTAFNRYFFAQRDRLGAVVDERYNGGGNIADYMVNFLRKTKPFNYTTTRYGKDTPIPSGAIYGPKVMLINEYAGSGGDELPWLFRRDSVGPLVGTRTWGGLVGIGGYPELMDGGTITAPRISIWSYEGKYEVENQGVAPDVEVEVNPAAWRAGHDVQLERAVAILMAELARSPGKAPVRPAFPVWGAKHKP